MASLLILRRPLLAPFSLGLGITTAFAAHSIYKPRPLLCDASPAARNISDAFHTYSHEAKVPVFRNGRPNPAAYRQLSAGSICGKLAPSGFAQIGGGHSWGSWLSTRADTRCGGRATGRGGSKLFFEDAGILVWVGCLWRTGTSYP